MWGPRVAHAQRQSHAVIPSSCPPPISCNSTKIWPVQQTLHRTLATLYVECTVVLLTKESILDSFVNKITDWCPSRPRPEIPRITLSKPMKGVNLAEIPSMKGSILPNCSIQFRWPKPSQPKRVSCHGTEPHLQLAPLFVAIRTAFVLCTNIRQKKWHFDQLVTLLGVTKNQDKRS